MLFVSDVPSAGHYLLLYGSLRLYCENLKYHIVMVTGQKPDETEIVLIEAKLLIRFNQIMM